MCIVSLIMHIDDQLGFANASVLGQDNLEFGQGTVSEKSGNFTFLCFVEILQLEFVYRLVTVMKRLEIHCYKA